MRADAGARITTLEAMKILRCSRLRAREVLKAAGVRFWRLGTYTRGAILWDREGVVKLAAFLREARR